MDIITEKKQIKMEQIMEKWYGTNHGKKKIKIEQIMEKWYGTNHGKKRKS